jgi:neutral ceramidase
MSILVGACEVDITPEPGTHLSGSGMGDRRSSTRVLDPLFAKAVVFQEGEKRFCVLVMDNTIIAQEWTDALHAAAGKRFGLKPEEIMVQATQTHSAPALGRFMLDVEFPLAMPPEREYFWGGERKYTDFAHVQALKAIEGALKKMEAVEVAWGRAWRNDLAWNRREERHIDPELLAVGFRSVASGKLTCLLLHYTCHPVNVFLRGAPWRIGEPKPEWFEVSADWPGIWCQELRSVIGAECVPIVLNGCCGNINPEPYRPTSVWDHLKQGQELAKTTKPLIEDFKFGPLSGLCVGHTVTQLDYREVPAERLAKVEELLSAHPQGLWRADGQVEPEWFYAASTRSIDILKKREPRFNYEIYTARIGPIALVGLPGEPFTEGQVAIKKQSPAEATIVAHMVSHYVGYLPTREAYARFGHEANANYTYWAKLAPGSLEQVVERSVEELLQKGISGKG